MMRWLVAAALARNNRRSLVALDNLVDLIDVCIDHPAAANRTLLVSDCEDLSTSARFCSVWPGAGAARKIVLSIPERWIARLRGFRAHVYQRLVGNRRLTRSETCVRLAPHYGWRPWRRQPSIIWTVRS